MDALLQVLPDKQREIVILRVVVGLSAEETADAVGKHCGRGSGRTAPSAGQAEIRDHGDGIRPCLISETVTANRWTPSPAPTSCSMRWPIKVG